jgi:EmrB/QacA subfamily drug resistance transporter
VTDPISVSVSRRLTQRAILVSVALGGMLVPLNSTMIAVALPNIMREFGADVNAAGWLVTAYLITMATFQLIAGKLGDQLGRRALVLGGLIYFGLASLAAAVSPSLLMLLFFRIQQAIAGAVLVTNGIALVFEVVPAEHRGSSFGLVNTAIVLAAAAGPPLGGLLVGAAGWRAMFWANIPLVLAALFFGWSAIPAAKPRQSHRRFDIIGALAFAAILSVAAGLLAMGRGNANVFWLVVGGLVLTGLGVFFVRYEAHHPEPVLQPMLFRRRTFASANGAIALSNLAMYVTLLALPILLSNRLGWTSFQTGLVLTAMSAAMALCSPLGGRLADRLGRRLPSVVGLSILTISMLPLTLAGEGIEMPSLLACLGVAGAGLGLSVAGLQTSALESVEPQQAGMASGVSSTSRYLGSIVGSSILAGLLASAPNGTSSFRMVFLVVTLAAMCAALGSLGIRDARAIRISA